MSPKNNRFFLSFTSLLFCVFIFILFLGRGATFLDPDFGWHLRNGEIFLKQGIFFKDRYSYTMPSFPVISFEWLSDILIFFVYQKFRFLGLSLVFSFFFFSSIFIIFYIFLKSYSRKLLNNFSYYYLSVSVLIFSLFLPFFSIRPQVLGWFCWSLTISILFDKSLFRKCRFFLPFLVWVWANLHGSFPVGLFAVIFILGFSLLRNFAKTRRVQLGNVLIIVLALISTFINPFGIGLWREVISTFFSSSLRVWVGEWATVFTHIDLSFLAVLALSIFLLWRYRTRFRVEWIILYLILLVQGVTSQKNIPIWAIFSLIFIFRSFYFFNSEISHDKFTLFRLRKAGQLFFGICIFLFITQIFFVSKFILDENLFYPKGAISYLKLHLPIGQIFSDYGWGGYLVWKLPEKKVFIDGRMAIWSWKANVEGETNNAFDDYLKIIFGKAEFTNIFDKYNIDTVLWQINKQNFKNIFYKNMEDAFLKKIQEAHWVEVYRDSVSVIYNRPNGERSNTGS